MAIVTFGSGELYERRNIDSSKSLGLELPFSWGGKSNYGNVRGEKQTQTLNIFRLDFLEYISSLFFFPNAVLSQCHLQATWMITPLFLPFFIHCPIRQTSNWNNIARFRAKFQSTFLVSCLFFSPLYTYIFVSWWKWIIPSLFFIWYHNYSNTLVGFPCS